jgi:GAF domain-containing protein
MSFAAGLGQALQLRQGDVVSELDGGQSLEHVLARHLNVVEQMSDSEILTSVLLLSEDGKHLTHGAAPSLPQVYREAIDGLEIGPSAGSCGTAAYTGRPVYVTDIANDPLWAPYRDLALPHGLRSCWSTPIKGAGGDVLGTFAIYHRSLRGPTRDELNAIDLITHKVAEAIGWARNRNRGPQMSDLLPRQVAALGALTAALKTQASTLNAEGQEALEAVVAATENLAAVVERQLAASGELTN